MKNHGGRFLFVLILTALSLWLWLSKGIKLGLDLDGGSSVTYAVRSDEEITRERLNKAIEVIDKRVNATGLTEIYIASTASNEIVVEMPRRSVSEIASVKKLIERNGQLEFRIQAETQQEAKEREKRDANPRLYRVPPDRRWVPLAEPGQVKDILVRVPEGPAEKAWLELRASKGETAPETIEAERELRRLQASELFRGEDLDDVDVTRQELQIVVAFELKDARKSDFGDFTGRNVGKNMAIILDGKVSSAPVIQGKLPGRGVITGGGSGFDQEEADALRIVLESGSTGVRLELEREETLGASLGQIAIDRGELSVLVGFGFVVALMLWFYRLPGIIPNVALLLNVIFTLGLMAFFRGALSLPGIAGIVLTLGMAVDANILIFERLRDERRRGKSLQESLAAGYDNAMSAIIDGNVTTLLTALVLIWLGTGAVKGFGVTLTIGLVVSMFTAIWVTRTVFEWLIDRKIMTTFDIGPDPWQPKIDYMRHRRWFTLPSLALMVVSVAGFLARDEAESKDLEFIGGQQVIVQLREPVGAEEITSAAKGADGRWKDATAVRLDPTSDVTASGNASNRWQIRAKADTKEKGLAFVEDLRTALAGRLLPDTYDAWKDEPGLPGRKARTSFRMHTITPAPDPSALRTAIESQGMTGVSVERIDGDPRALAISLDSPDAGTAEDLPPFVKQRMRTALATMKPAVELSDPFPSVSYLSSVQAEAMWRLALEAVLLSLAVQVLYIRLRFADYTHGFAAVIALVHDVTIALGAVALFDAAELVYAKVNLVLIASFLTLIGYSMNDTIVIFDRIRENLGRSKTIRSRLVNDSINQTFARSIRTGMTVFLAVIVQFAFNRGLGSSIEGFAWVMIIGSISGSYSSIFMAAPLLLFLPGYARAFAKSRPVAIGMCLAAVVGSILAVTAKGHGTQFWTGVGLASLIPIHFLALFVPWLAHPDPDSLIVDADGPEEELPLQAPGV